MRRCLPPALRALLAGCVVALLLSSPALRAQQTRGQSQDCTNNPRSKDCKDSKKGTTNASAPAANSSASAPSQKPKPLFGGSLNLKSSRQSKDATTLGFNGLDPNGQVQKSVLDANPTPQDTAAAEQVAAYQVNPAQLDSFIKSGDLNENAPPKEASKGKK
jgi:hypothetical protein